MYVYVIAGPDHSKIGVSKNPEERLAQLQTGNPYQLTLVKKWPMSKADAFRVESVCHRRLKHAASPAKNEWFQVGEAAACLAVEDAIVGNGGGLMLRVREVWSLTKLFVMAAAVFAVLVLTAQYILPV